MYGTETLPIDRVSIKNIFLEKSSRKYSAKANPRPLYNFGKSLEITIACKKFWRYFERGLSKSLIKGNFIVSFEPSLFH